MEAEIKQIDKQFELNFSAKIPNSTRFQVDYFGFKSKIDSLVSFRTKNTDISISELIKFLEKKEFKITLCNKTKKILDAIKNHETNFLNKKNELEILKDSFESKEFLDFSNSLSYLKRKLKNHQSKSLYHLTKAECAAIFSVPGSGKTAVVLAFYEKLRIDKKVDAIFIIGPKNCYNSWNTEFNLTLKRNPKIEILDSTKLERQKIYNNLLKSELYASHFMTVANDIEKLEKFFTKKNFLIVIDEAHNIKKIDGMWSRAILKLANLSKYKVILTGTPMPQDFKDFYNYLDFLYDQNEIINSYEKAQIQVFMENKKLNEAALLINQKIYPFYTRVTKKELMLSKPNFIKPYLIKMNPIENKIHEAIKTKIKFFSKTDYQKNIEIIKKIHRARIIRLRQNCSYVKNLITAIPTDLRNADENFINDEDLKSLIATYDLNEKPAKLFKLKSIVNDLVNNNKKVLIWSTHLKTIELIKKELSLEKINIKSITGKTKLDERESIKNEFNDNSSQLDVIIAIPQACSESISLHKSCQNAIYYDLNYNTSEFLQSLDRIHRVGGSEHNPVFYHFLQYENSIDIKVHEKVFQKADRQMQVIEQDNLTFSHPEGEDWDDLYSDLNL